MKENTRTLKQSSILIVEDSQDDRLLLQKILKSAGYEDITIADSADKAFEHLGMYANKRKPNDARADLILMDIMMPDINGIEASNRIKAIEYLQDIPVVMVTASTKVNDLQLAFDAGAVEYITKPFNKVELLTRVGAVLRLKLETDRRKAREKELQEKNLELEKALLEVKELRSLIPICAWCKKVRDDHGYWKRIEEYLQQYSGAAVTHSICPECKNKIVEKEGL